MKTLLVLFLGASLAAPALAGDLAIGTLRTRDHEVRIVPGDPPRYTVTDRRSRVLVREATLDEIARRFPDLHRALTRGVAGAQDATLR